MIEINTPGECYKGYTVHLHYNDWPLLVTFCWNVNKLGCLFVEINLQYTVFVMLFSPNLFPLELSEVFVTLHHHLRKIILA